MKRFIILMIILLFPVLAHGQEECPLDMEAVMTQVEESCASVGAGEICLGHAEVSTIVNCEELPEFDSAGDTIPIDSVCAMRLGAPEANWGAAVMKVLPHDVDQPITYVLFGDMEIQNAASALNQVKAWVVNDSSIYSGPGSSFSTIGNLVVGDVAQANACNCTRHWLRIVLDDGTVGWIPARNVSVIGDENTLPEVQRDTPLYASMQAFQFHSDHQMCTNNTIESGILIQVPSELEPVPLRINGVEITLNATAFVQSQADGSMTIAMLDGIGQIRVDEVTAWVPAGTRVLIPMSEQDTPNGVMQFAPYKSEAVADLPVALLPEAVDVLAPLANETPQIIGGEPCNVVSGQGETICPLHFVNYDGDAITRMEVEFLYAPQGEWTGSVREPPILMDGNDSSGTLAWNITCSLGAANFIGPIRWNITLTDSAGHKSDPFEASFNCVAG